MLGEEFGGSYFVHLVRSHHNLFALVVNYNWRNYWQHLLLWVNDWIASFLIARSIIHVRTRHSYIWCLTPRNTTSRSLKWNDYIFYISGIGFTMHIITFRAGLWMAVFLYLHNHKILPWRCSIETIICPMLSQLLTWKQFE